MGLFGKSKRDVALEKIQLITDNFDTAKYENEAINDFYKMAEEFVDRMSLKLFTAPNKNYFNQSVNYMNDQNLNAYVNLICKVFLDLGRQFSATSNESFLKHTGDIYNSIYEKFSDPSLRKTIQDATTKALLTENIHFYARTILTILCDKVFPQSPIAATEGDLFLFTDAMTHISAEAYEKINTKFYGKEAEILIQFDISINSDKQVGVDCVSKDNNIGYLEYGRLWALHYAKMCFNLQDKEDNDPKTFFMISVKYAILEVLKRRANCLEHLFIDDSFTYQEFNPTKAGTKIFSGIYGREEGGRLDRMLDTYFPEDTTFKDVVISNLALLQYASYLCENTTEHEFLYRLGLETISNADNLDWIELEDINMIAKIAYYEVCTAMGINDPEVKKFGESLNLARKIQDIKNKSRS